IALGYRKGLTGALLKIISFVLAIVIAFVLFKPVSNFIVDKTNWDENLEQGIRDTILSSDKQEEVVGQEDNQNMPAVMLDYINKTVENAGSEAKEAVVDATARQVAVMIINSGVWLALFLVARLILIFVKGLANIITSLPIIKQFDKLGGIIYGLVEAFVIIYALLAVLSFISPVVSGTGIIDAVQKSFVGSAMYNNNLLLKLIF
ncbi:MAG: CvpA family protein, partial [Clostridia bacterium]|nr:CvpA family protein [Clostridia bacterium]